MSFDEPAARIADRLAASAIWHRGRCNWVGPTADPRVHAALGPDLDDGTAGLALFLAEAAVALGEPRLAETARGAIRHAVAHAGDEEGGVYRGRLGIDLAARRIAGVLGDEAPLPRRRGRPAVAADVESGAAGAILALLALPADVDAAAQCGEHVLDRAERSRDGWSWAAPGRRSLRNHCGFLNGTVGIALALLELSAVTGDPRFQHGAERAFDYERAWRRRAGDVWPDLRGIGRSAGADAPVPAAVSWCDGAPGALLARLRCARLATGPYLEEAAVALAQTRALATRMLEDGVQDASLRHGAAGVADALLIADPGSELPAAIGRDGLDTPALGLLDGLAGVGLFYLRLVDRAIPSPIMIHRDAELDPIGDGTYSRADQPR